MTTYAVASGLTVAGIYMLIALGFTILLRADIVNLAHGAFVVGGMYATAYLVNSLNLPYYAAICIAVIVGVIAVTALYRILLERALPQGHRLQIIYTLLILSLLQVIYQLIFGAGMVSIALPLRPWNGLGMTLPLQRVIAAGIAVAITFILYIYFKFTATGKAIEVVGAYPEGSMVIGLPVRRLRRYVFALGSGMALLAGALIFASTPVTPFLSLEYLVVALIISLVGRLSYIGVVVASIAFGIGYQVLSATMPSPAHATITTYSAFVLAIAAAPFTRALVDQLRAALGARAGAAR